MVMRTYLILTHSSNAQNGLFIKYKRWFKKKNPPVSPVVMNGDKCLIILTTNKMFGSYIPAEGVSIFGCFWFWTNEAKMIQSEETDDKGFPPMTAAQSRTLNVTAVTDTVVQDDCNVWYLQQAQKSLRKRKKIKMNCRGARWPRLQTT